MVALSLPCVCQMIKCVDFFGVKNLRGIVRNGLFTKYCYSTKQ